MLDDTQFTLHYWDWTNETDRNAPFDADRLGTSSEDGTVTGTLIDNWYSVCKASAAKDQSVCNPKIQKGENLRRCDNADKCKSDYPHWPSSQNVSRCLMLDQFRRDTTNNDISNKYDNASFSNYLEGFAIDDLCDMGDALCYENEILSSEFPKSLHNQVSLILQLNS